MTSASWTSCSIPSSHGYFQQGPTPPYECTVDMLTGLFACVYYEHVVLFRLLHSNKLQLESCVANKPIMKVLGRDLLIKKVCNITYIAVPYTERMPTNISIKRYRAQRLKHIFVKNSLRNRCPLCNKNFIYKSSHLLKLLCV